LKKYIKNEGPELYTFLEYNKPLLFGYYRRKIDSKYNVYLRKTIGLNYTNVLYGVQIRSYAKRIMYKYFNFCDKNNIKIYYCNTDSIVIKESDLYKLNNFISENIPGKLKISGVYNNGCEILSKGKYKFVSGEGNDKNKIRNMS
jgi:hypothetical protein